MITFEKFTQIDNEVQSAVEEALDYLKNKTLYYVLFLANGEYKLSLANSDLNVNANAIDNRDDKYIDKDRRKFLLEFMNSLYGFPNGLPTDDNDSRIHMELMIYTHIWEAKPFLKQLSKLALIIKGELYPWQVKIPDMSKHKLIRNEVRDVFQSKGLSLATVIRKGFHTSLRNAFAHSEYYFNEHTNHIVLYGNDDDSWRIPSITYDDWSIRFLYSVSLAHHLQNKIFERRSSLIADYGRDRFVIMLPTSATTARPVWIKYDPTFDMFRFVS